MRNALTVIMGIVLGTGLLFGAGRPDDPLGSLPKGLYTQLKTDGFFDQYELATVLNPYFQRADFNGDGRIDAALFVRSRGSGKYGIIIVHSGQHYYNLVGAGKDTGHWGDDLAWLQRWQLVPRDPNREGVEALILTHPAGDHALFFWNGIEYTFRSLDAYSYYSDDIQVARRNLLPDLSSVLTE